MVIKNGVSLTNVGPKGERAMRDRARGERAGCERAIDPEASERRGAMASEGRANEGGIEGRVVEWRASEGERER